MRAENYDYDGVKRDGTSRAYYKVVDIPIYFVIGFSMDLLFMYVVVDFCFVE